MDKYSKYYGVAIFMVIVAALIGIAIIVVSPKVKDLKTTSEDIIKKQQEYEKLQSDLKIVQDKITKIKSSISASQKRIYSPIESDLGNETLFFTLYNDMVEMLHANSIKIKSIDYTYNPEKDAFVDFGKDVYFVCDINMEIVSNYVNLGKLIQDIYQYPYYIRINEIDVKPYPKDKKILLSSISVRLYAHTAPEEDRTEQTEPVKLNNATKPLPQ